jgi:UDP-N-acetylglucosamine--N-acetylmuramyl-(pentapeptide) pyrophosphoryl-undecaprenol N-acetylglucosamine transferase
MKILLTGGGTGGHITPLLAVAHELKTLQPDCHIVYVGEKGGKFAHLTTGHEAIDEVKTISAGKFRRYHGESFLRRIFDIQTNVLNIRDGFRVVIGFVQACLLLRRVQPDVVFLKGGFVGVPTGLAARFFGLPVVTHDSDIMPGLANRIAGRSARIHATAMPAEHYPYPKEKVRHVGVLVSLDFQPVTKALMAEYRHDLGLPTDAEVVFVTGGSQGSRNINTAIAAIVPELLTQRSKLHILHQTGKGNEDTYSNYRNDRLHTLAFVDGLHRYSGAADVIITRAGANTLAEFGIQRKACIVVPHPLLTGGHQVKNAEYLRQKDAALVVSEADIAAHPAHLLQAIVGLLDDSGRREQLSSSLNTLAIPDASRQLAMILLEVAKQ